MKPLNIGVRKITETVLRCGDIDNRYVDSSVMLEGARAHRKIQKSMGDGYQKEVTLEVLSELDGAPVKIKGRADGVFTNSEGLLTVDEIKTTSLPLDIIYTQRELHLGQGKCYAYMLMQEDESISEIAVQLTYYQLETDEIRRHNFVFTRKEIDDSFTGLLQEYAVWMRFEREWKIIRDESVKLIDFPYPEYRKGQRELAVVVYRTVQARKNLYAEASTGIGKTLSALFPCVKLMGEGGCDKLFYLTAKTVTRTVAEDSVRLMLENGLRFKSITLRAKDKICFTEEKICNPVHCEYAKGHYDRVNAAVLDVLEHEDLITPSVTEAYAGKHRVCPHEFALDITLWVDLVVGDYNHVFDPVVYLHRFFSDDESKGEYIFLIDEAHNMTDRVRDMYSAVLAKSEFYRLKKEIKDKNGTAARLRKSMGKVNDYLKNMRRECEQQLVKSRVSEDLDEELLNTINLFIESADVWIAENSASGHAQLTDLLSLYFAASAFVMIASMYGDNYMSITEIERSNVSVTLFCLDPSEIIASKLLLAKSSIFFSATLTPLSYYREMLGGSADDYMVSLPSPFSKENFHLAAHTGISTKYVDRETSYIPICRSIYEVVSVTQGNYFVFFPSYSYMKSVYEQFCELYPEVATVIQYGSMSETEREEFLAQFDGGNLETLIGFCVLGGIFSEGIDLKGNRLIGTVIVGVGLPGISLRQDEIKNYFNRNGRNGYDFAYVFPGMNKIMQAAGRVIRTETDRGVAVLIDSRFETAKYKAMFPNHWSHMKFVRDEDKLRDVLTQPDSPAI